MRYLVLSIALAVALANCPRASYASGVGKVVTKATQAKLGLAYELSAIREPQAVIVSMTIPKTGNLKDLRIVRLSILADNQKDFLIRAPLEMTEEAAGIRVSAQLAPELAAKASLDLVVQEGRREFYYAVKVADYISERAKE